MRNVPRTTGLLIAALCLGLFASSAFAIGPTSDEAAQNGRGDKAKVVYNADGSVSRLNRPKCRRGELPVVTGNHWTCKPAELAAPEPEQTALLVPAVQKAAPENDEPTLLLPAVQKIREPAATAESASEQ